MIGKLLRPLKVIGLIGAMAALSACGESVEVPTAHVAKKSGSSGLLDGIIKPSRVWLSSLCFVCDNLIVAEVGDYPAQETMKLFMKDNLNLEFDVRGTLATSTHKEDLEMVFARVSPDKTGNPRIQRISSAKIYDTYGRQVIRSRVRSVMSKYTISEVMANRDAVSQEIETAVREAFSGVPIKVVNFGLADMQPPKVVVDAEEARKKREIEIARAEADEQVRKRQAEADLEVAKLEQAVELKQAETDVMVQRKLAEGFNQSFLARRGIGVLEKLAESENKIIFLPTEALSNPAVMLGSMNASIGKLGDAKAASAASSGQ